MSWGDIDAHGKPVSKDQGKDYIRWTNLVRNYGYNCDSRVLNSANFGSYTSRSRLFIKFARPELPLVWPEPTYCKGGSTGMFAFKKWKPVREVLDLEDEGKSIFNRPKPLVDASHERIYAGLIKFVAGGKDKWILKYNSVNGKTGKHNPPGIDEPCPTVTCQGRLGIFISKYYSGRPEGKVISIEGPAGTIKTKDGQSIISPKFMYSYYSNGDNISSLEKPCPTVPTKDKMALISTNFIDQQFGNSTPGSIENPLGCITTNPKYAIVNTKQWLMNTNFNNVGSPLSSPSPVITANHKWHYLMNPQYKSSGSSIDKPCFTLIARMDKMPPYIMEANTEGECAHFVKIVDNVITYEIYDTDSAIIVQIKEFMSLYGIIDIKMRMLKIPELKMIMGFPSDYILIGTQAEQKKYIGNAVDVTTSTALCEATSLALYHYKIKIAV